MACDPLLCGPILNGLPPILKVNIRTDRSGHWLEHSILHLVDEAASNRAGGEAMLAKLSEALFVDTLRRYEVGLSRSALVERFSRYLSEPPMACLTGWRLRLAARALTSTPRGVAEMASDLGYESEEAFNRAFERTFGLPPARYRREHGRLEPQRSATA
jgi:AraC-like DNA-binding protein